MSSTKDGYQLLPLDDSQPPSYAQLSPTFRNVNTRAILPRSSQEGMHSSEAASNEHVTSAEDMRTRTQRITTALTATFRYILQVFVALGRSVEEVGPGFGSVLTGIAKFFTGIATGIADLFTGIADLFTVLGNFVSKLVPVVMIGATVYAIARGALWLHDDLVTHGGHANLSPTYSTPSSR
ncbi:unnamed protein product [Peniophora sp. CBMAI 1063]|nr:unnamed protein product [Peniophora sp. CBMAI 1063]